MRTITGDFDEFEQYLRDGLAHLYDPTYQPPQVLWDITGSDPQQGVGALQTLLTQQIETLKPAATVPPTARAQQIYDVLACRYLQNLTQEEAADRLGFTSRTLRRIQQQAVRLLAQQLWAPSRPAAPPPADEILPEEENLLPEDEKSEAWRVQLREELAYLQQSAPGLVANVDEIIQGVIGVGRALTSPRGVTLKADLPEPNLLTTAHASILRPALIRAVERLVQHMASGEIIIAAETAGDWVKITLTGSPTNAEAAPYSDFIHEAVTAQGGQAAVSLADNQITFELTLPSARPVNVVVVDDNEDLVHFYRRYVAGTRYTLTHLADGRHLFETIAAAPPDIIVLDVMLPGVDGWELLTQLHAHPASRSIPVIVCSVVRGRDMAAALGAALYLQKPVRSRQFIEALERVLPPAPATT